MSETLQNDIDRLWIACRTMKRHLRKENKSDNEKKLLEQDLKNLFSDVSRLNLLLDVDEYTPEKIGDPAIVDMFKREHENVTSNVAMAVSNLRHFVTNAVYNQDKNAIQALEQKIDRLLSVLSQLKEFNIHLEKLVEQKEAELRHLRKLVG